MPINTLISNPINWDQRQLKIVESIGFTIIRDGQFNPIAKVQILCLAADCVMFVSKSLQHKGLVLSHSQMFALRVTPENKQIIIDNLKPDFFFQLYKPTIHF